MASAVSGRAAQYAADGHGAAPVAEQVRILAADLVMWRHPAVSGVTLAACLIAYYLLYWRAMTALTLVAITALLQMLVLFIMRFVQRVAAAKSSAPDMSVLLCSLGWLAVPSDPHIRIVRLVEDMEIISATWLSSHSAELSAALNAAANAWRRICLFQSPALTYRVVVVLVAVALVGCILDLLNLFLISTPQPKPVRVSSRLIRLFQVCWRRSRCRASTRLAGPSSISTLRARVPSSTASSSRKGPATPARRSRRHR